MGTKELDVDELARASDLMPKWCVLTRTRKAERACENTTSAFVGHELVDPKCVPAHAGFGESFEDHCGEGFHVNSS